MNNDQKENKIDNTVVYSKNEICNDISHNSENDADKPRTGYSSKDILKLEKLRLKEKSKANNRIFRRVWIVMVVLVSAMLTKYILVGVNDMLAISRQSSEEKVVIEIPQGAKMSNISGILYDSGIINDKSFFTLYSVLTKSSNKFTKGKFELTAGMDYEAIVNHLQTQSNRMDVIDVTFPEGKSVMECAQILSDNGICDYNEFLSVCNSDYFDEDYDFISEIKNTEDRYFKLEGYLFPDTYTFYQGEDPKLAVTRFLDNYEKKIYRKRDVKGYDSKVSIENIAKEKGMSLNDLLILASLIQAEAANTEDMYYVSSVFHNRLKTIEDDGRSIFGEYDLNKLKSCATVLYPYKSKEEIPSDKANGFQSKYDTYNIIGLPAGSICNPGLDAIDAALNPKDTDYYYFCHSNDGESYYAKTMAGHQENLAKAGLE